MSKPLKKLGAMMMEVDAKMSTVPTIGFKCEVSTTLNVADCNEKVFIPWVPTYFIYVP
jgi:hypothetical protein